MAEAENKDPSMDEILQSIKRIISEESEGKDAATPAAEEDVLELTELVHDDGSVESVKGASEGDLLENIDKEIESMRQSPPEPQKPVELEAIDRPPEPEVEEKIEEPLVSERVASAAAARISEFREKVSASDDRPPTVTSPQFRSGETVEDLVIECLRPMLKEWLDLHMTDLVERIIEREIRRISGR